MGIGSAAIMFNINFILDNLGIRKYFDAIVSADHVTISKPDPETFLSCAGQLGVEAKKCLVLEDASCGQCRHGLHRAHHAAQFAIISRPIPIL